MKLTEIVLWGRSFEEYRRMFDLRDADPSSRILACADGPASFNAEATAAGYDVVSCDPIYTLAVEEIGHRVEEACEPVIAQLNEQRDDFVWDFFRDPDDVRWHRLAAMHRFVSDFDRGKQAGRYVAASLPHLPFPDGAFRLALISHLLFLYSDLLDEDFHIAATTELLRVASEVRIYPLVTLGRRWSPHVTPVRRAAEAAGCRVDIIEVPYEFLRVEDRAGNRMMRISRPGAG